MKVFKIETGGFIYLFLGSGAGKTSEMHSAHRKKDREFYG